MNIIFQIVSFAAFSRLGTVTGQAISTKTVRLYFGKISAKDTIRLINYGENPASLTHSRQCRFGSCVIDGLNENTLYHFKIATHVVQIGESAVTIQVRTLKKNGEFKKL